MNVLNEPKKPRSNVSNYNENKRRRSLKLLRKDKST